MHYIGQGLTKNNNLVAICISNSWNIFLRIFKKKAYMKDKKVAVSGVY